jgi:hypothetical protein
VVNDRIVNVVLDAVVKTGASAATPVTACVNTKKCFNYDVMGAVIATIET